MIIIGDVELRSLRDLGDDRLIKLLLSCGLGCFGCLSLCLAMIEDRGAILGATVGTLAI